MKRFRPALILIALVLMAAIGADLWSRASPAHRYAHAIARGYGTRPVLDSDASLDDRLNGDANEAGNRWAERHGLDQAGACQALTAAFRTGCEDYVREQAP